MSLLYISIISYLLALAYRGSIYPGLIAGLTYLFIRGIEAGRLPLVGPHDTLVFLSLCLGLNLVAYNFSKLKDKIYFLKAGSIITAFFSTISLFFKPYDLPVPPVIKTSWFEIHVVLAFLSYSLFGIGSLWGVFYLIKKDTSCINAQYVSILIGYSLFSFSMIAGGIWAYYAWGSYWLWTPKELWTSILWLFYTLYLHLRLKGQHLERAYTIMGIAGFGVVLFTYLGVSLLMKSSHSF